MRNLHAAGMIYHGGTKDTEKKEEEFLNRRAQRWVF
jgi:hypothetical protein